MKNKISLNFLFGETNNKQLFNKVWEVNEEIVHRLHNRDIIVIPKGFITDLSSVPKFLWSISKPFGDFLLASIVHDYLYTINYRDDRKFADKEMLIISNKMNNRTYWNRLDNKIRYRLVRMFGGKVYKK